MFNQGFNSARQTTGEACSPLSPISVRSSPALSWASEQQQQQQQQRNEIKRRHQDRRAQRDSRRISARLRSRRSSVTDAFADAATAVMDSSPDAMGSGINSMGLPAYAPAPAAMAYTSVSLMGGETAQMVAGPACPFVLPPYGPPTPEEQNHHQQPSYQIPYQHTLPHAYSLALDYTGGYMEACEFRIKMSSPVQGHQAPLPVPQSRYQDASLSYQLSQTGIMPHDVGPMTTATTVSTSSSISASSLSPSPPSPSSSGRAKPCCWEHGCNGRQFSTFSNLLRHQREKSGQAAKATCPNCGAEFTRTTARNGHMQHDKCKRRAAEGSGV